MAFYGSFFSFAILCHSAIFDCACHSGLKARMPLNAILLAPLSSLVSRLSSNEKRPLHTRVVAFLFAHAPQHLLLRLLSTLLHERASMYALQKHSAKILFFYYIKKPSKQIFQQFIVVPQPKIDKDLSFINLTSFNTLLKVLKVLKVLKMLTGKLNNSIVIGQQSRAQGSRNFHLRRAVGQASIAHKTIYKHCALNAVGIVCLHYAYALVC